MKIESNIIATIFNWAWRCGIDVTLTSVSMNVPINNPVRFTRKPVDPFITQEKMSAEFPRFIFRRDDKQTELVAQNWDEMMKMFDYKYEKIFSDLCCPDLVLK